LFSYVLYPAIDRVWKLTPLRKIGIGLFLTVVSFLVPAWVQSALMLVSSDDLVAGSRLCLHDCGRDSRLDHLAGISPTPRRQKRYEGADMSLYYLSFMLGNSFTALVNKFIQNPENQQTGRRAIIIFSSRG